jgi:hypothetical protein
MTILISLFLVQVQNLLPEMTADEASVQNRYQQIKQAVIDYSRIKPNTAVIDLTGDGGRYYAINSTNFSGYSDTFSRIQWIQYPGAEVSADENPQYLDREDWDEDYYDDTDIRYLFLPNHNPATTEFMRIGFSAPYIWSASTTTVTVPQNAHGFSVDNYVYQNASGVWVSAGSNANLLATHQVSAVGDANNFTAKILQAGIPEMDFFTVCNRAACLIATEIAARYSRTSDSTITADSVNHPTRAQMFASRAKEFCSRWEEAMGISGAGEDGTGTYLPASEFIDWDVYPNWPVGRDFLFHGSRSR